MSTGNIVVSQDAPAKNNLWIQPKGTARFWNGSIWKAISGGGGGGDITLVDLMGSSPIGTQYNPLYWTGSAFSSISYTLSSTVNTGTANALAYYNGTNSIDDALHLRYYEGSNTATTPASYYRLHLYGSTYGNTAANMISGTAGLFSFGDGGPQITFDTATTPGGSQAGALIFTDHDTAATGASWHFVSNQSDWNVTSKRFHARTGISIGTNLPNTSYNFYVNGTSYFNSTMKVTSTGTNRATFELISNGDYPVDLKLGRSDTAKWSLTARKSTEGDAFYIYSYVQSKDAFYIKNDNTLNVGIGTTSPSYKLDVNGDIGASNSIGLTQTSGSGDGLSLYAGPSSNPDYGLMFATTANYGTFGDLTGTWATYFTMDTTYGSKRGWAFRVKNTSTIVASLSTDGNFCAKGGVTALASSSSDKRLKKNIKPFNATEIVDKLKPIQFEWNNKAKKYNNNFKDGKNYGLIAQDSDGIIDDLVFDLPDGKGYKGVRYEKLIPILLQAIKEQNEKIESLEYEINVLKGIYK